MKKSLIYILAIAVVSLTSCLKDKPNTDFSSIGTVIELPYAGLQYFSRDAITDVPDDNGDIVKSFGINIASAKPLSTDTKYTVVVDNALLTAYNATPGAPVVYEAMPTDAYSIDKLSGTIKAGQRLDSIRITFHKSLLDPSKSYMLPIKLASASNGVLSGNFNAHYYHFIGNDFAGDFDEFYDRWSTPDSLNGVHDNNHVHIGTETGLPVSATELTLRSFYYIRCTYHITFTKTGTGPTATFSHFQVAFLPDDVQSVFTANGLTLATQPVIVPDNGVPYDDNKQYTYAEALHLFRFYYLTGTRAVIDSYKR